MNLTGHWKGKYTYGNGYPLRIIGDSESFEFDVIDEDGIFNGTCIDNVVEKIPGNSATIEGVFEGDFVSFIKRYKFNSIINDSAGQLSPEDIKFDGIHYTGHLLKKMFSGKEYFKGEWTITSRYRNNENGKLIVWTVEGTWRMERS